MKFTWTAPGNDLNFGRALYYKIYCGYQPNQLSYHDCKSLSESAMYANPSGTLETFQVQNFDDFDREIFFSIKATDGTNEAEASNIVSLYIHSLTTSTGKTYFFSKAWKFGQKLS